MSPPPFFFGSSSFWDLLYVLIALWRGINAVWCFLDSSASSWIHIELFHTAVKPLVEGQCLDGQRCYFLCHKVTKPLYFLNSCTLFIVAHSFLPGLPSLWKNYSYCPRQFCVAVTIPFKHSHLFVIISCLSKRNKNRKFIKNYGWNRRQ